MHRNAVFALRRGASLGPGAVLEELGPWLVIDADTNFEFLNVAVVRDPARNIAGADADHAIERAAAWFGERSTGFCFLVRDDVDALVLEALSVAGYHTEHELPALVLAPLPPAGLPPERLEVVRVRTPSDLASYGAIGGEEQGLDRAIVRAIARTASTTDGFTLMLGLYSGVPVATSLALVTPEVVGVYNVNVIPAFRGRGIGTALTWAAIEVGRRAGCSAAFLESTPVSHTLYERIGFRTQFHYLQVA